MHSLANFSHAFCNEVGSFIGCFPWWMIDKSHTGFITSTTPCWASPFFLMGSILCSTGELLKSCISFRLLAYHHSLQNFYRAFNLNHAEVTDNHRKNWHCLQGSHQQAAMQQHYTDVSVHFKPLEISWVFSMKAFHIFVILSRLLLFVQS